MTDEEKIAQMWLAESKAKKAAAPKTTASKKRGRAGVGGGSMVPGATAQETDAIRRGTAGPVSSTASAITPPPKVKASKSRLPGMKKVDRLIAMSAQFDGFGVASARPKTNLDSIVSRQAKRAMSGSQKPFPDKQETEAVCKGCNQIYPKAAMKKERRGHVCRDCA